MEIRPRRKWGDTETSFMAPSQKCCTKWKKRFIKYFGVNIKCKNVKYCSYFIKILMFYNHFRFCNFFKICFLYFYSLCLVHDDFGQSSVFLESFNAWFPVFRWVCFYILGFIALCYFVLRKTYSWLTKTQKIKSLSFFLDFWNFWNDFRQFLSKIFKNLNFFW